jgi:very-short-patch-repair endonuclease
MEIDLSLCESPIEFKLGEAMQFVFECSFPPGDVRIIPQYALANFRYDFAIKFGGSLVETYGDRPVFLIECDGKQFHGNKQLRNDLAKDEAAVAAGSYCLRYRGSDINRNPYLLATELVRAVDHMRKWATIGTW